MGTMRSAMSVRARRVAVGASVLCASAAVAAGTTVTAPPAHALVDTVTAVSAGCMAGDPEFHDASRTTIPRIHGPYADCRGSSPSIVARVADGVLGLFIADLDLSSLNGVAALGPGSSAEIKGLGFNTAVAGGLLPASAGTASAHARDPFSAAIAAGGMRSTGTADSLLGAALAVGLFGGDATASGWLGGLAMALTTDGSDVSATAVGGMALASSGADHPICSAVYATATTGKGSCTSILFLFQQYDRNDGLTDFAIKNPLDVGLAAPLDGVLSDEVVSLLDRLGVQGVAGLADLSIVPEFRSDLIRVVVKDGGWFRLESDVPQWLGGLLRPQPSQPAAPDPATIIDSTQALTRSIPSAIDRASTLVPSEDDQVAQLDDLGGDPAAVAASAGGSGSAADPAGRSGAVTDPVDGSGAATDPVDGSGTTTDPVDGPAPVDGDSGVVTTGSLDSVD
ncbi:hypothetical protein [Gordonia sp. FQ]|uniref:hypothetical protein n=1 Tax=Gordonia sp. FQ TaxID=3446634 RepID=UPI003F845E3F